MDSYVCLIAMDRRLLSSTWNISNAVWYSFALFWLTVASWLNFPLATPLFSHRRPVNFFPLRFGLPIIKNQLTFPFDYSWLHCFLVNVFTIWSFVACFSLNICYSFTQIIYITTFSLVIQGWLEVLFIVRANLQIYTCYSCCSQIAMS